MFISSGRNEQILMVLGQNRNGSGLFRLTNGTFAHSSDFVRIGFGKWFYIYLIFFQLAVQLKK